MASPAETVKKLEGEHKIQFAYLALANNMYINLYNKYFPQWKKNKNYKDTAEYKTVIQLGTTVYMKAKSWFETQLYLEGKADIPKVTVKQGDFLNIKKRLDILKQAKAWLKDDTAVKGIGIIPLIIWGVVAIVGAVSVAYITKRLTVTTQDRVDLMNATKKTCVDLKLTDAECGDMIKTTQVEETKNAAGVTDTVKAAGSGIMMMGVAAAIILFAVKSGKQKTT